MNNIEDLFDCNINIDQDDIDFCDYETEDVEKITEEEFFDKLEKEKSEQKIKKIIEKVLKERI